MADYTAEQKVTRRPRRAVEIVLLFSLALNIFVLGGVGFGLWRGWTPHFGASLTHERKFDRFFQSLGIPNLDAFQPFQDMRRNLFEGAHKMRMENQSIFDSLWTELQKPAPDAVRLKSLLDEIQSHRQAFQMTQSNALVDFLVKLQPEQRSAFVHAVTDRSNPIGQPIRGFVGY